MQNTQMDPRYQTNMGKFFGTDQDRNARQLTFEDKLKRFIGS